MTGFLTLAILIPQAIEAVPCALIPPSIISQHNFAQLLTAVHIGKIIYRMDAFQRLSTSRLKEELAQLSKGSGAGIFDPDRINFMKKGFTRYYLLAIEGNTLVMRICLTSELGFQREIQKSDIITAGEIGDLKATYQVFDIKHLLIFDKPQPRATFHSKETERCS